MALEKCPGLVYNHHMSMMPVWWNWQTPGTQNPAVREDRAGSTPATGTKNKR
jgi:hypothetical protein